MCIRDRYEAVVQVRSRRVLGVKALNRMKKRALTKGFNAWYAAATNAIQRERMGKRCLSKFVNKELTAALNVWYEDYQHNAACSGVVTKALLKITNRSVAQAWIGWREWCQSRVYQLALSTRVVGKMLQRALAAAWESWYATSAAMAEQELIMKTTVARLSVNGLVQMLAAWRSLSKEKRRVALICKTAITRMLLGKCAVIYVGWREIAWDMKNAKRSAKSAVCWMTNRTAKAALCTWRQVAHNDTNKGLVKLALSQLSGKGGNVCRIRHRREQHAMYLVWREQARAAGRREGVARMLIIGAANRAQFRFLEAWRGVTAGSRRTRRLLELGIQRPIHGKMTAVWLSWRSWVNTTMRTRHSLEAALGSSNENSKRRLYKAWRQASASARISTGAEKAAQRWGPNKGLGLCWLSWRDMAAELSRQERLIKLVIVKLTRRSLLQAWEDWMLGSVAAGGVAVKQHHFMARVMFLSLARATIRWREFVVERYASKHWLRRAICKMGHRALAAAFDSWWQSVQQESMTLLKMRAGIARLMHIRLTTALQQWRAQCTITTRQRQLISSVVLKMANRAAAAALCTWTSVAFSRQLLNLKAQKVLLRMNNSMLFRGYRQLTHISRTRKSQHRVVMKFVTHIRLQEQVRALNSWKSNLFVALNMADVTKVLMAMKLNFLYAKFKSAPST
eukprot:TRINITY_DN8130_c0_g1_i1.p1 TRINITY_DN8130_c0_g1~~TRINITY_DN8130_c0_g1_i1.p1  ORF type:complete len:679 (-),score=122.28 TRINITY_DN8130_c0_g1_i1:170-2206(-)